jgi:acetyltransferase
VDYPKHWEADVVLTDGGTAQLRPIRPDDADRLQAFHARLSPQTVYNRFFAYRPVLSDADVARFTVVDHDRRGALVAMLRDEIIGVVRYEGLKNGTDAEVAFIVEDAHQGRGLGPLLLEHLAAAARERGIERFVASVLPGNRAMLSVFRSAGYEVSRQLEEGYVELDFPIGQTETSLDVMRSREHRAEARSVQRLLSPRTVAVIGASRRPGTPGHELFRSLLANSFEGPVYPVNAASGHVAGVRAYADVREVPDEVDLAVVVVPSTEVPDVVRACAEKQVRGLVVVSGGFSDAGPEGRALLDEVVQLARAGGMRLIGPNAMGVVNTDPAVRLHATFAPGTPPPGTVGVFSQSGALAGTFLSEAARRSLGLSAFVSIGDRADVSGNDLLQFWQADDRTEVVLLHLQGFGNPRKFARIARHLGRTKPVVALKSGHGTGEVAIDALFASAGVVRVGSLNQLFSAAQLFAMQPLPAGRRVAIVGNSSALAAMAADACRSEGLLVPALTEARQEQLRALTGKTDTANPVDLGPFAGADELRAALDVVCASTEVDAVLAVVVPPPHGPTDDLAEVLRAAGSGPLPLLASFAGLDGIPPPLQVRGPQGEPVRGSVPSYASPEQAALALARATRYAEWRARPEGSVPELAGFDAEQTRAAMAALPHDGQWLSQADAAAVLAPVGIAVWPSELVGSVDEAVAAADRLGWPVAVKSADERWRHRLDVGAVVLGVDGEQELREAVGRTGRRGGRGAGVRAAHGRHRGVDRGAARARPLGGCAGLAAARRARGRPAGRPGDAHPSAHRPRRRELVRSIRGSQLLTGLGGGAPADVAALEDLLLRVGRVGEELPELTELVLDPVLVGRAGAVPLHAGVRLLPAESDPERGPRRLGASRVVL